MSMARLVVVTGTYPSVELIVKAYLGGAGGTSAPSPPPGSTITSKSPPAVGFTSGDRVAGPPATVAVSAVCTAGDTSITNVLSFGTAMAPASTIVPSCA